MTLIDLTSSPTDTEEDYLVDDTLEIDAPPVATTLPDSQPPEAPSYLYGTAGWIEDESDPEEET